MDRGVAKSFVYNTTCSMYEAYPKLKQAGITVYSVKIDAFTINPEDEQNPRELFGFINKIVCGYQLPNILSIPSCRKSNCRNTNL